MTVSRDLSLALLHNIRAKHLPARRCGWCGQPARGRACHAHQDVERAHQDIYQEHDRPRPHESGRPSASGGREVTV